MHQYYVIAFSEQDFVRKNHLKMYDIYSQAKERLTFEENRLELVYSLLNSHSSEETMKKFGSHYGFYFVLDSMIETIKVDITPGFDFNIIGVVSTPDIPKEANCKFCYCS